MKTEQEYAIIFARNLTNYLLKIGMTKDQLGRLVGVSRATVSDWTNGKIQPRLPMFFKICEALACDPNMLGGFTSPGTPEIVDAYLDAPRPIQQAVEGLLDPYKKGLSSASLA